MNSTIVKPISFFEYFVSDLGYRNVLENYLSEFISYRYIPEKNHTINITEQNDFGEFVEIEFNYKNEFIIPLLKREFNKSKEYLYTNSITLSKPQSNQFLQVQFNILQNIINNNIQFISNNNFVILPLRGLVNYINVLNTDDIVFELDENMITKTINLEIDEGFNSNNYSDADLIQQIFGFMNSVNEKREQILNETDFNLLIEFVTELVINETIPPIQRKLAPKLNNNTISFCFWVLHKKLYTTHRIKPIFIEFLKQVFENFNEIETYSLKKIFGAKTRVFSHSFLPSIIKDYLQR